MLNDKAFASMVTYIEYLIIEGNRPAFLTSLHRRYCQCVGETANDEALSVVPLQIRTIGNKIIDHFGLLVKLEMGRGNKAKFCSTVKLSKKMSCVGDPVVVRPKSSQF